MLLQFALQVANRWYGCSRQTCQTEDGESSTIQPEGTVTYQVSSRDKMESSPFPKTAKLISWSLLIESTKKKFSLRACSQFMFVMQIMGFEKTQKSPNHRQLEQKSQQCSWPRPESKAGQAIVMLSFVPC